MTNPFAELYVGGYNKFVSRNLQMTNTLNFNLNSLVDGLAFHTRINADYYNTYNQYVDNDYAVYVPTWNEDSSSSEIVGLEKLGKDQFKGKQLISGTYQVRNLGASLYFDYNKTFNDIHNISAMLIANGISITTTSVYQPITNANLGLQINYKYKQKYWVDFSGAIVHSTMLPEHNRSALSPTISLSWLMSDESFMKGISSIDDLKLSLSTGILNTDYWINDFYLYDAKYSLGSYFLWGDGTYNDQAFTSLQGANPDLTFVKRKEVSLTIEGSFFNRLLWLETNLFLTNINGSPTQRFSQYPSYYSDFVPYTNYNSSRLSGIDFTSNIHKKVGEIDLNLGLNAVLIKTIASKRDELYLDSYQNRQGKPTSAIFGLVSDGFFTDAEDITNHPRQAFGEVQPGDIKYIDQNNDSIIDSKDEVMIGKWNSPFRYAIHLSMSYKGLTLFIQATGSNGGYGMKNSNYYWVDGDDKYSEEVLNRWTEGTKNTASFPRLSSQSNNNNFRYSDFWLYKTDAFYISKIQLTYDLPKKILGQSFIRGFAVYVNGNNLLTLSENKDILDLNTWGEPYMRYFSAGIRANF
jgi:hypothetical protein